MNNNWTDYLMHKKSHKYLLKVGEGKDARYFYTQAEIDAYKQNQMVSDSTNVDKNPQMRNQMQNKMISDSTNISKNKNPNAETDAMREEHQRAVARNTATNLVRNAGAMGKTFNNTSNTVKKAGDIPEGQRMLQRKFGKAAAKGRKIASKIYKHGRKVSKPAVDIGRKMVNVWAKEYKSTRKAARNVKKYWLG